MPSSALIVFDLDGTLVDGDTTTAWMIRRIGRSWLRTAAAIAVAPFAFLLSSHSASRRWGASVLLWIASIGQGEFELRNSFRAFAHQINAGDGPVAWRSAGLEILRRHLEQGDTVVVATAAPAWLAEALIGEVGLSVAVVGSTLTPCLRGWVGRRHCRHQEKCAALSEAGYGVQWDAAYSDSFDDLPLMARAARAYLVNGSPRTQARFAKSGLALQAISWRHTTSSRGRARRGVRGIFSPSRAPVPRRRLGVRIQRHAERSSRVHRPLNLERRPHPRVRGRDLPG
jgi:phosphatidylglycerophosphatase C